MYRIASLLCILLGLLSVLTSAQAYNVARPSNSASITVVNVSSGQIKVEPGEGDSPSAPLYRWMDANGAGNIALSNGYDGVGKYKLEVGSTYTLTKIVKITNASNSLKRVSVTLSGNGATFSAVTGYIGTSTTPQSGPFNLNPSDYVQLVFSLIPNGSTPQNFTLAVDANPFP